MNAICPIVSHHSTHKIYDDFEVVLVDNGSTDGSVKFVKNNFPRVKLIQLKRNYGFAVGSNVGLKHARGKYVILLNADTIVCEHWLRELVKAADEDPRYKILASIQLPDQRPLNLCIYGSVRVSVRESELDLIPSLFASGACMLIRKDWITHLGYLFDPRFISFGEDADLSLRTILAGGDIAYVRNSKLYHYGGGSGLADRPLWSRIAFRNKLMSYLKVLSLRSLPKILAVRCAYILMRVLFRPKEQPKNVMMFLGLFDFFGNIGKYVGERRQFERLKARPDKYLFERLDHDNKKLVERVAYAFWMS